MSELLNETSPASPEFNGRSRPSSVASSQSGGDSGEVEKDTPLTRGTFVALADDGVVDRALHQRLLLKCGCSTLCFHDAADLMDDFTAFLGVGGKADIYADAILLDFDMPKMTGGEATAKLRAGGYRGPIVVLTGNPSVEGACLAAGATLVLKKPLTLSMLKDTLNGFPPSLCTETPRSLSTVSARGASQQVFSVIAHGRRTDGRAAAAVAAQTLKSSVDALAAIRAHLATTTAALATALSARDVDAATATALAIKTESVAEKSATTLAGSVSDLAAIQTLLTSTTEALANALEGRDTDNAAASTLAASVAVSSAHTLADSVAELAAIQTVLSDTTDALASALEARGEDAAAAMLLAASVAASSATTLRDSVATAQVGVCAPLRRRSCSLDDR